MCWCFHVFIYSCHWLAFFLFSCCEWICLFKATLRSLCAKMLLVHCFHITSLSVNMKRLHVLRPPSSSLILLHVLSVSIMSSNSELLVLSLSWNIRVSSLNRSVKLSVKLLCECCWCCNCCVFALLHCYLKRVCRQLSRVVMVLLVDVVFANWMRIVWCIFAVLVLALVLMGMLEWYLSLIFIVELCVVLLICRMSRSSCLALCCCELFQLYRRGDHLHKIHVVCMVLYVYIYSWVLSYFAIATGEN